MSATGIQLDHGSSDSLSILSVKSDTEKWQENGETRMIFLILCMSVAKIDHWKNQGKKEDPVSTVSFIKGKAPVAQLWGFGTECILVGKKQAFLLLTSIRCDSAGAERTKEDTGLLASCIFEGALYCSVALSCPTLCNPMDSRTSGFFILHYLPEFAQTQHPLGLWWHPTISSSVIPFFSCPQSFPGRWHFWQKSSEHHDVTSSHILAKCNPNRDGRQWMSSSEEQEASFS